MTETANGTDVQQQRRRRRRASAPRDQGPPGRVHHPGRRGQGRRRRRTSPSTAGRRLAIVGESGSGKSTTAHAIINLLPGTGQITGGQILLDGQDLTKASPREMEEIRGRQIGFVPQDPMSNLNPVWSIGFQVEEAIKANGIASGRKEVKKRAIEVLKQAGLQDADRRLKQFPHQFSGGMRQRVLIGMGLAADPQLLIADEPTSALDVTVQRVILDHLESLTARARHDAAVHHARPRPRGRARRAARGDVQGPGRRVRARRWRSCRTRSTPTRSVSSPRRRASPRAASRRPAASRSRVIDGRRRVDAAGETIDLIATAEARAEARRGRGVRAAGDRRGGPDQGLQDPRIGRTSRPSTACRSRSPRAPPRRSSASPARASRPSRRCC